MQNLKVSIRNEQASNASCITGTQYTELDLNENAEVIVVSRQPTTTQAGMTSNISQLETLSTFNNYLSVQAEVPSENQILVTTFETLDSTDPDNLLAHDLNGFTFVHRDKIYDSVETPDFEESTNLSHDVTETSLSISSDLVLNSKSAIRVLNDDIYTWQPVYDSSSNYSFAANSSEIDSWELYLQGDSIIANWTFEHSEVVDGSAINVTLPSHSDAAAMTISTSGCVDVTKVCLNGDGFDESDFALQRTHIRAQTSSATPQPFNQTIYGLPMENQPIMESSAVLIDVTSVTNIEVGLVESTDVSSSLFKAFAGSHSNFEDASGIYDQSNANNTDFSGLIVYPTEQDAIQQSIMLSDYVFLRNAQ